MDTHLAPKTGLDMITDGLIACGFDTHGKGWGPASEKRLLDLADLIMAGKLVIQVAEPKPAGELHHVKASSFADPADVAAFRKCKAEGHTDQHCFGVGDNGQGRWGDDCTQGSGPACALPPEDWQHLTHPRGARVEITHGDKTVTARLLDTMPARANIKNGCGIDLSPDTCAALGLTPPVMADVTWRFV